jgi:hypothetical protein
MSEITKKWKEEETRKAAKDAEFWLGLQLKLIVCLK